MKKELEELWAKYTDVEGVKSILDRGRVWFENDPSRKILVTGINPSFRKKDEAKSPEYEPLYYQNLISQGGDRYYIEIRRIIGEKYRENTGYLDLFAVRETAQKRLSTFLKNPLGLEFLAEHLAITQREIERLKPKLIIVKNKGSWMYWGKCADTKDDKLHSVWMGYKFEKIKSVNCGDICTITGLIDSDQRVAPEIKTTNLEGTIVLFTNHFQYCPKDKKPTPELIDKLYNRKQ